MVAAAPVASAAELSPVGELPLDVARGLAVLRVLEGEPLLVDMLVLVNPPVVVVEVEVVAQERPNPFTLKPDFMINAGEPTTITWEPTTDGTVSIRLRAGASSNLEEGTIIACERSPLPNSSMERRALTRSS